MFFSRVFSVFRRSVADYVTNEKRKTDRKETQRRLKEKLLEENPSRFLFPITFFE